MLFGRIDPPIRRGVFACPLLIEYLVRLCFCFRLSSCIRCVVLLIRDSRGAYYQSIYLDDHGEEDAREYLFYSDEVSANVGLVCFRK